MMDEPPRYVPKVHWARLHARNDLSAVGQSGLPASFNSWLYRNGARNLDRFLASSLPSEPATVYDAGAGTGFWVEFWMRRGARVDGSDLIESAVGRLTARFPGAFVQLDITDAAPTRQYDLVSCMNVLLHVLDDGAFEHALFNLAKTVAPSGYLLLAEPIARVEAVGSESRSRSIHRYAGPLREAGLELQAFAGTSVVGANPIESGSRLYPVWQVTWRALSWVGRRGRSGAAIAGRLIYLVDPLLLRLGLAPSGKFALFRRTRSLPTGTSVESVGDR